MTMRFRLFSSIATLTLTAAPLALAQLPKSAKLFEQNCIGCHANTPGDRGPDAAALRRLSPDAIVDKLAINTRDAEVRPDIGGQGNVGFRKVRRASL